MPRFYINHSTNPYFTLIRSIFSSIREIIKKPNKASNQAFDDIFRDVFIKSAENIAAIPLTTMEDITKFNKDLEIAINGYLIKKENQNVQESENTLESLYSKEVDASKTYKDIKSKLPVQKLLKNNAKHIQVLLAGSMEYYRYIKDHNLDKNEVIAIINDRSFEDNDLLITETGLRIHRGQSKTTKGIRRFVLASTGGLVPFLEFE